MAFKVVLCKRSFIGMYWGVGSQENIRSVWGELFWTKWGADEGKIWDIVRKRGGSHSSTFWSTLDFWVRSAQFVFCVALKVLVRAVKETRDEMWLLSPEDKLHAHLLNYCCSCRRIWFSLALSRWTIWNEAIVICWHNH